MKFGVVALLCACAMPAAAQVPNANQASDPRLREVVYDPKAVVTIPVKRGVVTLVMLDADEAIAEVRVELEDKRSRGVQRLQRRGAVVTCDTEE